MSFLKRLLGTDGRDEMRALWHASVATSREVDWYARCGAADSVEGRFDMIALVLSLVLLRMEQSPTLAPKTALLTELFVADMDRQLRDSGVGDLKVGKNMGMLMSALGGQLGALRNALADPDVAGDAALAQVLARNMRLAADDAGDALPLALAERTRALAADLARVDDDALLAGRLRT